MAGALYLVLILLGHNEVAFGSVWTLVLWSSLPLVLRGILQSAYMTILERPVYNQHLSGLVVENRPPPMTFD